MLKHLKRVNGLRLTKEAEDWVTICPAEIFVPQEGKRNGLFTMFEGEPLPPMFHRQLPRADYVIVPSTWVQKVFLRDVPLQGRVYVVPHGVSSEFKYKERRPPSRGERFRYLWVGSTDLRKGCRIVLKAWAEMGLDRDQSAELYMKASAPQGRLEPPPPGSNVILDNRNVSRRELVEIYHSAHAFLFPTFGEGFGLTLAEAMRTGLPCAATDVGGHMDFFDEEVGFPVKHISGRATVRFIGDREHAWVNMYPPEKTDFYTVVDSMRTMYNDSLLRGWRASIRIARDYTWQQAADKLLHVVEFERAKTSFLPFPQKRRGKKQGREENGQKPYPASQTGVV